MQIIFHLFYMFFVSILQLVINQTMGKDRNVFGMCKIIKLQSSIFA